MPHIASPAPIATANVFKIPIADVKNAILYLKPKSEFHGFYRFAQTKKPPVSPDGSPFPIWFILSFLLLYYFL